MDREVENNVTSQGAGSSDTLIPNEQETHDNNEDTNVPRSARYRKPAYPYELSFDGKRYGAQLFHVETRNKMTINRSLNIISANDIFTQVFQIESAPQGPGVHGKCHLREDTRYLARGQ